MYGSVDLSDESAADLASNMNSTPNGENIYTRYEAIAFLAPLTKSLFLV